MYKFLVVITTIKTLTLIFQETISRYCTTSLSLKHKKIIHYYIEDCLIIIFHLVSLIYALDQGRYLQFFETYTKPLHKSTFQGNGTITLFFH